MGFKLDKDSLLQNHVLQIVKSEIKNCTNFLGLLFEQGCVGGLVSKLAWFNQTTAFYKKHKCEISDLLADELNGLSPGEYFGKDWEEADPLALCEENQNLLCWFAFKRIALDICVI